MANAVRAPRYTPRKECVIQYPQNTAEPAARLQAASAVPKLSMDRRVPPLQSGRVRTEREGMRSACRKRGLHFAILSVLPTVLPTRVRGYPVPGWAVLAQAWGLHPQYDHPEQRRRAAKGWSRRGGRAILVHRLFVISSESTVGRELLEGPADTIREVGLSLKVPLRAHEEELAVEVPGMSIPHVGCDDTDTNPLFSASGTSDSRGVTRVRDPR